MWNAHAWRTCLKKFSSKPKKFLLPDTFVKNYPGMMFRAGFRPGKNLLGDQSRRSIFPHSTKFRGISSPIAGPIPGWHRFGALFSVQLRC
jgi:hypothetical protein